MSYVSKAVQKSEQCRVYEVHYRYEDKELGKRVDDKFYYADLASVSQFFGDLLIEREMLSSSEYHCRENIKITIKETYISVKFYNQLFH